jgi:protein-disulfide isomerase
MKFITAIFYLIILAFSLFAQKAEEILATANNQNFTAKDLQLNVREAFEGLPTVIADMRRALLEQQIADVLLETEAAARKITVEKLIEADVIKKVPNPTDKEIQAIYDANQAALGGKSLEEVRPQIIAFLKREPEQKALTNYIAQLKTKYKFAPGGVKDVNASNLKPLDVLATVGGKTIRVENFEAKNKPALADLEAEIYEHVLESLEQTIFTTLITAEAKAQNLESGDLLAREITDKMRDYTPDERERLQNDLKKRLFEKYKAKILLKEPPPFVQIISTDDDPARGGKQDAPVKVVMFSDFQCPACAATHPVLQQVLTEYGDKVRFVVRDFPLTTIHKNAFRAAVAASAAAAQGKYFEYVEILYKNQESLNDESLRKYAADLGLNLKQFELDLASEKLAEEVRQDAGEGEKYGVNSTPTIFVNGVKVRHLSADGFRRAIEKALKK